MSENSGEIPENPETPTLPAWLGRTQRAFLEPLLDGGAWVAAVPGKPGSVDVVAHPSIVPSVACEKHAHAHLAGMRRDIRAKRERGRALADVELGEAETRWLLAMDCWYCGAPAAQSPCQARYAVQTRGRDAVRLAWGVNGIDRVDSAGSYARGNVCTACWRCNRMKGPMGRDAFLRHINGISWKQLTDTMKSV